MLSFGNFADVDDVNAGVVLGFAIVDEDALLATFTTDDVIDGVFWDARCRTIELSDWADSRSSETLRLRGT